MTDSKSPLPVSNCAVTIQLPVSSMAAILLLWDVFMYTLNVGFCFRLQRVFPQWPPVYYSHEVHCGPDTDAQPQGRWQNNECVCESWMCEGMINGWNGMDIRLEIQGCCNHGNCCTDMTSCLPTLAVLPKTPPNPESWAVIGQCMIQALHWLSVCSATMWTPPSGPPSLTPFPSSRTFHLPHSSTLLLDQRPYLT